MLQQKFPIQQELDSGQKQHILKLIQYSFTIRFQIDVYKLNIFKDEDKVKDTPVLNLRTLLHFVLASEIIAPSIPKFSSRWR